MAKLSTPTKDRCTGDAVPGVVVKISLQLPSTRGLDAASGTPPSVSKSSTALSTSSRCSAVASLGFACGVHDALSLRRFRKCASFSAFWSTSNLFAPIDYKHERQVQYEEGASAWMMRWCCQSREACWQAFSCRKKTKKREEL